MISIALLRSEIQRVRSFANVHHFSTDNNVTVPTRMTVECPAI